MCYPSRIFIFIKFLLGEICDVIFAVRKNKVLSVVSKWLLKSQELDRPSLYSFLVIGKFI